METNPRVRMPSEWAPPPPVVVPDRSPPRVPPVPTATPEAEFEDILGSLVEHYSTLPPAYFGEPPETIFESAGEQTATTASRRGSALLWIALAVGGVTVAGLGAGGFYFWNNLRIDPSRIAADPAPAIKIAVKPALATPSRPAPAQVIKAPRVEPLVTPPAAPSAQPLETGTTTAAVPADERVAKPNRPAAVKRSKPRARRVHRTERPRAPRERASRPARASSSEEWEDPYK